MHRLFALLCLSPGVASVEAKQPAGLALPLPYKLQDSRTQGDRQFILASFVQRGTGRAYSLLLARHTQSGRTLWKQNLGWKFEFAEGWNAPGTVALRHLEGRDTFLYVFRIRDGRRVGTSRFIEATPTR